jgi:MFS superfamily sulfate permease-like transporter
MNAKSQSSTFFKDLSAGVVVFLVALPLCLGIALASNAPLISGLITGVVGGLLVAWLSGSHTSVSGPAAGLTAIVFAQIENLGSFEAFLCAVILAGVLQLILGWIKAGSLAAFFPSSVIKGLLAAIGIILILKQIPHLFGHDPDWMGDMSFIQPDGENTFWLDEAHISHPVRW